jgi:hypothetical protein
MAPASQPAGIHRRIVRLTHGVVAIEVPTSHNAQASVLAGAAKSFWIEEVPDLSEQRVPGGQTQPSSE